MEHLSDDQKDHPNLHKISHKLFNEKEYSLLSLKESQSKLRQKHDQRFQMVTKSL